MNVRMPSRPASSVDGGRRTPGAGHVAGGEDATGIDRRRDHALA